MKVKVWDLPLRLFHWSLVLAFGAAFLASRSERLMGYHAAAGYAAGGLVLFRILWGFAGNRYARFSGFITGFSAVRGYVQKALAMAPPRYVGHNPAVGWVLLFMLSALLVISATGVITYGGEEGRGPLAGLIPFGTGVAVHAIHEILVYVLFAVVFVHVSAAFVHDFVFRENIILSMITGTKEDSEGWTEMVEAGAEEAKKRSVLRLAALLALTMIIASVFLYFPASFFDKPSGVYHPPRIMDESGREVAVFANELWEEECGAACHNAFHPTLLPAGSWTEVMTSLEEHFGEDASLEEEDAAEITAYLLSSSAERSESEASKKILLSIRGPKVFLRVTETPYWKKKHKRIKEEVYSRESVSSKSNCLACHPGAAVGSFEDRDISIPKE